MHLRQHMLKGSSNIIRIHCIQCGNLSALCACLACKSKIFGEEQFNRRKIPKVRLAITTFAPFSFAPYATAFAAPPAPITTKGLPASGEVVGSVGCDAADYWSNGPLD